MEFGLNNRISARHLSTPFSLMFGRKPNQLSNYKGCISDIIPEEDLIDHFNLLTDTVYPALARVTDRYYSKMQSRHSKSNLIVEQYPVGTAVRRRESPPEKKRGRTMGRILFDC